MGSLITKACSFEKAAEPFSEEMKSRILTARALGFKLSTESLYLEMTKLRKRENILSHGIAAVTNNAIMLLVDEEVGLTGAAITQKDWRQVNLSESLERQKIMAKLLFEYGVREQCSEPTRRFYLVKRLKIKNHESYALWSDPRFYEYQHWYYLNEGRNVFSFSEVKLEDYNKLPSSRDMHILRQYQTNEQLKSLFDYYTVGWFSNGDQPVLFGRIIEDDECRWIIHEMEDHPLQSN